MRPVDLRNSLFALALLVSANGFSATTDESNTETTEPDQTTDEGGRWYDSGHSYLTNRADSAAQWMDGFFGEEQADVETAASRVRLRLEYKADGKDGNDFDIKLRGKLYLPAGANRLSLVFEGEEDNEDGADSAAFSTDDERSVALQYNVWNKVRERIDISVGAKAGPKAKLSARYRYNYPLNDRYLLRFTDEVFWVGGDGFGNLVRTDIDRVFERDRLLRWTNRATYSEESNGVEWNSRVLFRHRLDERTAMGYFTSMKGETQPSTLTKSYSVGMIFRRNFLRRWLFFEVEPSYRWRKGQNDTHRDASAVLLLRLEIAFDATHLKTASDATNDAQ